MYEDTANDWITDLANITAISTFCFIVGLLLLFADGSAAFSAGMSSGAEGVRKRRSRILASAIDIALFPPWITICRVLALLEIAVVGRSLVAQHLDGLHAGRWFHIELAVVWIVLAIAIRLALTFCNQTTLGWLCAALLTGQTLCTFNALELNAGLLLFDDLRGKPSLDSESSVLGIPCLLFWWSVLMGTTYTHAAQFRRVFAGWIFSLSALGMLRIALDLAIYHTGATLSQTSQISLDFGGDPFFLSIPILIAISIPMEDRHAQIAPHHLEPSVAG